jgi:dihydropteroate synthase
MQNNVFSTRKTLNLRGELIDLHIPKVMGILNVTPDSFYDGGRFSEEEAMLTQVGKMIQEGADFVDIGGYSTRPGAREVTESEELSRVLPVIDKIKTRYPGVMLSVDTFRSSVAQKAVAAGAAIINDVSGGQADEKMFEVVARAGVPYILMHMRGTPQTMTGLTRYDNLLKEIMDFFYPKITQLHRLGVPDVIVDPGFGFAKTPRQGFELLRSLDFFAALDCPLMVGLSRKSMIWKTLGTTPANALNGSTVLNTIALSKGASILRVHDVREAVETRQLFLEVNPVAEAAALN